MQKTTLRKIFVFTCLLLIFTSAFSQTNILPELQTQFEKYALQHEQEKLFVHTDKTFYLTGETIWFKVYDIDAGTNKTSDLSKVAYIEVLGRDQKPVLQAKIGVRESSGNGSLIITSSITTGNYIVRAYTNWMKNFGPDLYFEKIITIVNPLKSPERPTIDTSADYDAQFFPEGGNLVYGIESKIAFRVAGRNGKGVAATGMILAQNNDTVARFQSLLFGLGQFQFTPQQGNQYKALITTDEGKKILHELPAIYDKGFVMSLTNPDRDHIKVSVNTNQLFADQSVYLFIYNRQRVSIALMKAIQNGKAEFVIDKNLFEEGISHLIVFNTLRQPVCERLYFRRPQLLNISLKADRNEYTTRQKVDLELSSGGQFTQQVNADMSMSVYRIDSLQPEETNDISTYTWLTSELKGTVESPQYYLNNNGIETDRATDNLLLTHGWTKFNWEVTMQNKNPSFAFIPEYAGPIISCRITDKKMNLPAKGITAYASLTGKRFQFNSSSSDESGLIHFNLNNFYGAGDLVIQTNNQKDSLYNINILNPFSDEYLASRIPDLESFEKKQSNLLLHIMSSQVQSAYASARPQQFLLPVEDTTSFYGKGDRTYFLDDYTRFATMEEVMREYVTEVLVRKSGSKFHYRVSDAPYKLFFETDPLVLIDGVPVFDINKIIDFNPIKIKKMDILTRRYYLGGFAFNGIISYATYDGDLGGYQLDPGSLIVEYQGLQLQRQFYSPVYEMKQEQESRLPDLRNVLLWSPQIRTDNSGKQTLSFYTSDLPGKYMIMVQGITSTGLAGSATAKFTIKK